jgi:protein TonB
VQVQKVTVDPAKFVAPTEIPKDIPPPVDEPPVVGVSGIVGGIAGGITGGQVGGVPGGVAGGVLGSGAPPPPPPPPPRPVKRDPIRVGGNVQESKLIKKVEPVYPELAKRARVSGVVILQVTVDEEGSVTELKVLRGHPLLDEEAKRAVQQWKYSPTLLNGEPVPVIATVTVIFNLK